MIDRKVVDALFDQALDLSEAEREAFLDSADVTSEVRAAVERLLAVAKLDSPTKVLGGSLWRGLAQERSGPGRPMIAAGSRLGPYTVVGPLGRGGMAVVYLAQRSDGQFDQKVALKILDRPAGEEHAVARFERERRILATLEHPGIARILDGGITDDGRPWFAMQYIDGCRIDEYCDSRCLSIAERLRLFVAVTRAVAAAHQQLVVHRDIKPANILVAKDGGVWLLDFGIAKLVDAQDPLGDELTRAASPMTPRYASPEQVSGRPVTTASDVFQLGLLLYELLVGNRAGPLPGVAAEPDAAGPVREPTRPSLAAFDAGAEERAKVRGAGSAKQLHRALAGDLDTIVLAALRPQPERRYESASRLADDIERFLDGRPITARPESWLYRGSKFLARNRWSVAAAGIAVLMIVGLSVVYAVRLRHERDVASREAAKAQRVSEFLTELFAASDPFQARQVAARTALELLDEGAKRLVADGGSALAGEAETRAALLHTIATVYRGLMRHADAEPLFARAAQLRGETLGAGHPDTILSELDLAIARGQLHRLDEALVQLGAVVARAERSFGSSSLPVAKGLREMAVVLQHQSQFEQAAENIERAVAIYRLHSEAAPTEVSLAYLVRARILHDLERFEDSLASYDRAIEVLRAAVDPQHPLIAPYLSESSVALYNLGRFEDGRARYREALRTAEESPRVQEAQRAIIRLATTHGELVAENWAAIPELIDRSIEVVERDLGGSHFWIGLGYQRRASAMLGLGRYEEGLQNVEEGRRRLVASFGEVSGEVLVCDIIRADLLAQSGRRREAIAELEGLVGGRGATSPAEGWRRFGALISLARAHFEDGDLEAAEARATEALRLHWQTSDRPDTNVLTLELLLARVRLRQQDPASAATALARIEGWLGKIQGVTPRLQSEVDALRAAIDG